MQYLLYNTNDKKESFFCLSDEVNNSSDNDSNSNKKNICKSYLTEYKISKNNMPHKFFKDNIVIYGRKTCPYCQDAINYLKSKPKYSDKIIFVLLDSEPSTFFSKVNLLDILKNEIGGHTTVPMTFYKGKFIGGCDDTKEYFKA